jgi:hypothetical protein
MQAHCPKIVRVAEKLISLQLRAWALVAHVVIFTALVEIHELAEHWMIEHIGSVYPKIAALVGGVYACFLLFYVVMYVLAALGRRIAAWALWSELSLSHPIELGACLESPGEIDGRAKCIDVLLRKRYNLTNSLVIATCLAKVYSHIRLVKL